MRLFEHPVAVSLRRRPPGEKRFLVLVPLTGVVTGLASVALIRALALVQLALWGNGHEIVAQASQMQPLRRILPLVIGGLAVGLIALAGERAGLRGHGTGAILEAVARGGARLPVVAGLIEVGGVVLTVGSGGSLGREGSLARMGSTIGSVLGRRFGTDPKRLRILVGCGFAAGIAAAYNAPIGGALFALEVILGTFALESFGPIIVSSALGTMISRLLVSEYTAYSPPPLPPLESTWDVVLYSVMGLAIGLASAAFILVLGGVRMGFRRLPVPRWLRPAIGFALVGLIGLELPQVLGNGYEVVNDLMRRAPPVGFVALLVLAKVAATAVTRGSGGLGGLFTPTLFIGSALGSAYGTWSAHLIPGQTAGAGAYALVGMGAMLAGTTQAPLTAILMIFELTGDYPIILPLMLACAGSMFVCRMLGFESVYTQGLSARGIRIGGRLEELVMDRIEIGDVMRPTPAPARDDESLSQIVHRLKAENRKEIFVVDGQGRLAGSITLGDLSEYLAEPELLESTPAREVIDADVPVLHAHERLAEAIDRWSKVTRDRLPVIDAPASRRLVGELSAGDIFSLYSQEVLHAEPRLAGFRQASRNRRAETTYIDLPREYGVALVRLPETFAPATIRDLEARRRFGVNIIEIERPLPGGGERRIIPEADTELRPGDAVIVVGRETEIARLNDPGRRAELFRIPVPMTPPSSSSSSSSST